MHRFVDDIWRDGGAELFRNWEPPPVFISPRALLGPRPNMRAWQSQTNSCPGAATAPALSNGLTGRRRHNQLRHNLDGLLQ